LKMIYIIETGLFFSLLFQKNITDRLRNSRGQVKLKKEEEEEKNHPMRIH